MKYLTFDDNGMVACYDVVPVEELDNVVEVADELAEQVLKNPKGWRLTNGEVTQLFLPEEVRAKRLDYGVFDSGVVIDGVCYAANSHAIALLALGSDHAIVHRREGDAFVEVDKKLKDKILTALKKKVMSAL